MRKLIYYAYVVAAAVPYWLCYAGEAGGDYLLGWQASLRYWAFPGKYARLPRGDEGYLVPPAVRSEMENVFREQILQPYERLPK